MVSPTASTSGPVGCGGGGVSAGGRVLVPGVGMAAEDAEELACLVPVPLARTPTTTNSTTRPARIPPVIQGHLRRLRCGGCGGWPGPPGGGCQDGPPGPGGGCSAGRFQIGRFSGTAIP